MTVYYIGTSGWHYEHWKGVFYPGEIPRKDWLGFYSNRFNTVEVNNSFYHLPSENAFRQWYNTTGRDFRFAVKASRGITHIKRLKDPGEYLQNLLDHARPLKKKLAVMLFQLPPQMKVNIERLETFLQNLPRGLKAVFEFRDETWMDKSVYSLLEKYHTGFCIYDMPGYSSPFIATSDFAYIRFHGNQDLYLSSYPDAELKEWARKIRRLEADTRECYIYFNNDAAGAAIENALTLIKLLR